LSAQARRGRSGGGGVQHHAAACDGIIDPRRFGGMAALAERRIIPHDELKKRSEEKAEAVARPEHMRLLEALLFAASIPLDEKTLAARLPEDVDLKASLRALQTEFAPRGVNLVRVGNKWTFRTATDLSWLLTKEAVVPRK